MPTNGQIEAAQFVARHTVTAALKYYRLQQGAREGAREGTSKSQEGGGV